MSQMTIMMIQADRMVIMFLAWIEYLITVARSTDIANTVSMLARAVLTVMNPKLWQTGDGRVLEN